MPKCAGGTCCGTPICSRSMRQCRPAQSDRAKPFTLHARRWMETMGASRTTPTGFGALLRKRRHAANLTQEQLAARAGIHAPTVSDLERGVKGHPRLDTTQLLVDALDLHGDDRVAFMEAARKPVMHRGRRELGSPPR